MDPHPTRRQFLVATGSIASLAPLVLSTPDALLSTTQAPTRWYDGVRRWGQTNISEKCVLDYVLSVFLIVRNMLRDAEDIAIIPAHQFAESLQIAILGCLDKRQLAGDTFPYALLDGFHAAPTQK
jgi:hypothetical protein